MKLSPAIALFAALACLAGGVGMGWFFGRASPAEGHGALEPVEVGEALPTNPAPTAGSPGPGLLAEAPTETLTDHAIPIELDVLPPDLAGLVLEVQGSTFEAPRHPRGNCEYDLNAELLNRTGQEIDWLEARLDLLDAKGQIAVAAVVDFGLLEGPLRPGDRWWTYQGIRATDDVASARFTVRRWRGKPAGKTAAPRPLAVSWSPSQTDHAKLRFRERPGVDEDPFRLTFDVTNLEAKPVRMLKVEHRSLAADGAVLGRNETIVVCCGTVLPANHTWVRASTVFGLGKAPPARHELTVLELTR